MIILIINTTQSESTNINQYKIYNRYLYNNISTFQNK